MKEIAIAAGEIGFSKEESRIATILGSCIAVTIFDKVNKYAGMCHYKLPKKNDSNQNNNFYGEFAIENLLKKFTDSGSKISDLEVKLIGGGKVADIQYGDEKDIGEQNIKIAREVLRKHRLIIKAESVGGIQGKKVRISSQTGEVQVKKVESQYSRAVTEKRVVSALPTPTPTPTPTPISPKTKQENINVLVVDDSSSMRTIVKKMLAKDPAMTVIGEATNGIEAQEFLKKSTPDIITLDINMPEMDGVTFLKSYMDKNPIPTIMVSSLNQLESGPVFDALESGAFAYFKKPALSEIDSKAEELCDMVHAASESQFIRARKPAVTSISHGQLSISKTKSKLEKTIIAIGSSTGGTEALKVILKDLPQNVPPIIISQHIPPIFSTAFATRLNELCSFNVKEAENGDVLEPGNCYIAPGDRHIKLSKRADKVVINITTDEPVNRFRPSVDYMFNSVYDLDVKFDLMIGIILTGMGGDGAKGLLNLKKKNAVTIAQDKKTCTVFGMPKVAIDLGAVKEVKPLDQISKSIVSHLNKGR